jgi:hypothetical protein
VWRPRLSTIVLLCLSTSSCATSCGRLSGSTPRPPTVQQNSSASLQFAPGSLEGTIWAMDNLLPISGTVLTDGNIKGFSIDLAFKAAHEMPISYESQLAVNRCLRHPFKMTLLPAAGSIDFRGTITWYGCSGGRSQTIDVKLYLVQGMEDGAFQKRELLKEITGRYVVRCNPNQFAPKRTIRKWLGYCFDMNVH